VSHSGLYILNMVTSYIFFLSNGSEEPPYQQRDGSGVACEIGKETGKRTVMTRIE
jgi:hypothetical protein